MPTGASADSLQANSFLAPRSISNPYGIAALMACLMIVQASGFALLGTTTTAITLSQWILVIVNIIALTSAWSAFRRARSTAALFWLLFIVCLVILLVPGLFLLVNATFHRIVISDAVLRVLWCLYAAPIIMMLFVPDAYSWTRVKLEIFLDLFQVAVVIALTYTTFFYLPIQQMLPPDALLRNVNVSNLLSVFLLCAIIVRLLFARSRFTRDLLYRLTAFVVVCAIVTYVGYWIDLQHYSTAAAWFDLGWDLPLVAATLVCATWKRDVKEADAIKRADFFSLFGTNLFLVGVLSGISLLRDSWRGAYGELLTNVSIIVTLIAFTVRLALTQYRQQQEASQREGAQKKLIAANEKIAGLLEESRAQARSITQVSELGSLLQGCDSQEQAFRVIPERLQTMLQGTSGSISILLSSKNRQECKAEWGELAPAEHTVAPADCWALRRACTHIYRGGDSKLRCQYLRGDGPAVCIPLIANGETLGTLAIQQDAALSCSSEQEPWWRPLASAASEHVALALSNLNLRDSLRTQAVRDPLTGLYNRRYMEEFLEREVQRSRRQHRCLSVLMLDLDHFKSFNDRFGHGAGDDVLRCLGDALLQGVRSDDVACRYGGEEFVLVLPDCSLDQAAERAREICTMIKMRSTSYQERMGCCDAVSVSIGVAAFDDRVINTVPILLRTADQALYQAKHDGRDRVVVSSAGQESFTQLSPTRTT